MMEWKDAGGSYQGIADGGSFTASHDGVYSIHVVNSENAIGNSKAAENYKLSLVVDYSQASNPVVHDTYTVSDNHGGTATGNVDISYQSGHTLNGTAGDDVLLAGTGENTLNGGDGNDVLVAGNGTSSLYGGAGTTCCWPAPAMTCSTAVPVTTPSVSPRLAPGWWSTSVLSGSRTLWVPGTIPSSASRT